ncbi:MAG: trypsin-like peptidase domain-containing protein, partial [Actinobacteria bacterium]|nr:trypsin-like peptidase domain-containing protein [Actinomycetota bacterium]
EVYVQFNTATAGTPDASNADYMRAEVIDFSPWDQRDIAILKIQSGTGRALSGIIIGDSSLVEIQDSVTIIGYPWTGDLSEGSIMTPTVNSGAISARKMIGGAEVFQIDSNVTFGNSGGPVLNDNGEVIGLVSFGPDTNTAFLATGNDIREMINRNGIENKVGMVYEEFEKGLIGYRQENYSDAISNFNAVLNLSQGHLSAQEYRSKAQQQSGN